MVALAAAAALAWYEAPSGTPPRAAIFEIFAVTYLVIAVGRLPGFRLDRAGAAMVGASLMLAVGGVGIEDVARVIDFDTVALLLGMMIVVGNLRLSGFFRLVTGWTVARARHPLALLATITLTSGLFSAFLLNDAICLVMTPLVADIVAAARAQPDALSARRRNGRQYRQRRDDHRQSAEHSDRRLLAYPLRRVRRSPGAGRRGSGCCRRWGLSRFAIRANSCSPRPCG